jgi:hypothetical protein
MDFSSLAKAAALWYICSTFKTKEEEQKMVRGFQGIMPDIDKWRHLW